MQHKTADLGGEVHYLDFGGTGEPVLMVHGLGGSAINWMAVGPEIARHHRALALDLAGFGQTPLLKRSAAVGPASDLVHSLIDKLVGEPVLLIGNSTRAHIAILDASNPPVSYTHRTLPTVYTVYTASVVASLLDLDRAHMLRSADAETQ